MSEEVTIQSTSDSGPTLEQQAAALDAKANGEAQETGKVEQSNETQEAQETQRPEWLLDKYLSDDRSIQDAIAEQAKAYTELQKKLGERQETQGTQQPTEFNQTLNDARNEFFENDGKLSEDTYTKLTEAGLPKELVDSFIESQQATIELQQIKLHQAAGGQKQHDSLLEWGGKNLTAEEIELFNADYTSGNMAKATMAIRNLQARYQVANGSPAAQTFRGDTSSAAGVQPFSSMQEVKSVMKDPRYKSGDKAFHDNLQKRLAVTNMASLPPKA